MKICLGCLERFESKQWTCPKCGGHPASKDGFVCFAPNLAVENEGFAPQYFSQLSEVEENHFWFEGRNQLLQWALQHYFPRAQTFLEVGCGTGFVLGDIRRRYPWLRTTGADVFTEGLRIAQSRAPEIEFVQMDARQMPFDAEFDVVGAFDALEHIEEDKQVLTQLFRSCRPGGGMILTVPQHPFLWSAADEYAYHKRRYTKRDLVSKIRESGFDLVRVTSFVSLLLPLMLVSRLRRQKLDKNFDNLAEFRIRPGLNRALKQILLFEERLISIGISLPAGGSLLVVARKPSNP
jgi:ubiquinone/menaquinone biosynthesis C-methylase UbiE